jgi:hypothetical protein
MDAAMRFGDPSPPHEDYCLSGMKTCQLGVATGVLADSSAENDPRALKTFSGLGIAAGARTKQHDALEARAVHCIERGADAQQNGIGCDGDGHDEVSGSVI